MKKKYWLFAVIAVMCAVIIPFCNLKKGVTVNAESNITSEETVTTVEKPQWQIYLEENVFPQLIATGTSISILLSVLFPIINKVKKASDRFKNATNDVEGTVKENKKLKKEIEELKAEVLTIKEKTINTEKIVKIGFSNTEELVNKGIAAEIIKVGSEDENTEENV